MTKKFRYGLFGMGRMGQVHGAILQAQGQEIVAIGDENIKAIDRAAEALGLRGVPGFARAADMARQPLDAVVISSNTQNHTRDALPFVQAGIPVYLEKPLTADLQEAFDFVREIGTSRHLIQIGLQRRFDEALCYARGLIQEGLIGVLREIRCVLRDQSPPPNTYTSRGLIRDMGIHVSDEAVWLCEEFPCAVWARLFSARDYDSPLDEGGNTAHVGFLTPNGVIGRLDISRTHASGYNNETHLIGTRGTLHVGRFAGYPGPIPVELWTDRGELHERSRVFTMTRLPPGHAEFQPRFQQAYARAHRFLREAVESRSPFEVTQHEILQAQVFTEAAHLSATRDGAVCSIARPEDLSDYETECRARGILPPGFQEVASNLVE